MLDFLTQELVRQGSKAGLVFSHWALEWRGAQRQTHGQLCFTTDLVCSTW